MYCILFTLVGKKKLRLEFHHYSAVMAKVPYHFIDFQYSMALTSFYWCSKFIGWQIWQCPLSYCWSVILFFLQQHIHSANAARFFFFNSSSTKYFHQQQSSRSWYVAATFIADICFLFILAFEFLKKNSVNPASQDLSHDFKSNWWI